MNEKILYNKYSDYLKEKYGEKVYKLPINLPLTCPNRINGHGCSFCADVGTGFEAMQSTVSVTEQLEKQKNIFRKIPCKKVYCLFSKLYEHIYAFRNI